MRHLCLTSPRWLPQPEYATAPLVQSACVHNGRIQRPCVGHDQVGAVGCGLLEQPYRRILTWPRSLMRLASLTIADRERAHAA